MTDKEKAVEFMEIFDEEYKTDDELWCRKGDYILKAASRWDKETADDIFIALCGWSLNTLIARCNANCNFNEYNN